MILQSVHRVIEIVWYIYPYLPPKSSRFLFPGIQILISQYFPPGNCQPWFPSSSTEPTFLRRFSTKISISFAMLWMYKFIYNQTSMQSLKTLFQGNIYSYQSDKLFVTAVTFTFNLMTSTSKWGHQMVMHTIIGLGKTTFWTKWKVQWRQFWVYTGCRLHCH